ncbi:MAG: glycosyltransferase family 4 protein [Lachnospiraceae bacterium]
MNQSGPRFVTLFPRCRNTELLKDVGMIPYCLYKNYGYRSSIACYQNEEDYSYLKKEVKGLTLEIIPVNFHSVLLDGIWYLIRNAKKIEILNVYHLILSESFIWIWLYRLLNPKGFIYLKLDLDFIGMREHEQDDAVKKMLKKRILKRINLISAESEPICVRMENLYGIPVKHIPNGFYRSGYDYSVIRKENIFLTVGRLGTRQKATEVLLEAFARSADQHNWSLRLVGGVESDFQSTVEQFYKKFPKLKDRVVFTGMMKDKEQLMKEYARAKVFLLPSRWEGYAISLVEAMSEGCYIIVSDVIPPAKELTENGKFGAVIKPDDTIALAAVIAATAENKKIDNLADFIRSRTRKNNDWNKICEELYAEFSLY